MDKNEEQNELARMVAAGLTLDDGNVVTGLYAIAEALKEVAFAIRSLAQIDGR